MRITQKQFRLFTVGLMGLGVFGFFLFFRGGENKKPPSETQISVNNPDGVTQNNTDGLENRDVSFVASDGYKLSGTLWTPDSKERHSVVILSHQFNSTRHDYDAFMPILLKNGYAILAYDTRG